MTRIAGLLVKQQDKPVGFSRPGINLWVNSSSTSDLSILRFPKQTCLPSRMAHMHFESTRNKIEWINLHYNGMFMRNSIMQLQPESAICADDDGAADFHWSLGWMTGWQDSFLKAYLCHALYELRVWQSTSLCSLEEQVLQDYFCVIQLVTRMLWGFHSLNKTGTHAQPWSCKGQDTQNDICVLCSIFVHLKVPS